MVGLHLLYFELLIAARAEPFLPLIGGEFLGVGEGAEREELLLTGEEVWVDAALVCHIVIEDEARDLLAQESLRF